MPGNSGNFENVPPIRLLIFMIFDFNNACCPGIRKWPWDKKSVNSENKLMCHPDNYKALNIHEVMKAISTIKIFRSKHKKNLK